MAVIDYAGFNDLTTAIGGVDVYIPETVEDTQQDVTWEQGWTHLEGERALQYVRTRHGLLEGDFDRIDRQQNFLRAVLHKTLADGTIGNPFKLTDVLSAISTHLAVDGDWSTRTSAAWPSACAASTPEGAVHDAAAAAVPGHPGRRQLQHHRHPGRQRSGRPSSTTRSAPTSRSTPTTSCRRKEVS
jgi:hypothetical protein